jgi:hypothetical protein
MILAVADCADGKGPPPGELQLAWQARGWGALPEAGGLLDQPAGLLDRMSTALSVYDALAAYKKRPAGHELEFSQKNPREWDVVLRIRELRGH